MVALIFLILFLLPFTLTLLLVPFLRAKSHLNYFCWINTLKPFFDTYYGPFKDKKQHQAWTGILLIFRIVILIVYASTSTSSPNTNILMMTLISILLLMYSSMVGLLYKKWSLSLLENLYFVNLTMLGGTFLFYQLSTSQEDSQINPVATTSVIIALFSFLCSVIIYTAKRITPMERICRLMRSEDVIHNQGAEQPVSETRAPTSQVIELSQYNYSEYREKLLETVP